MCYIDYLLRDLFRDRKNRQAGGQCSSNIPLPMPSKRDILQLLSDLRGHLDGDVSLEDGDGSWEDERWSPFQLTVMSGTEYKGREIPIAWQIEFDPASAQQ